MRYTITMGTPMRPVSSVAVPDATNRGIRCPEDIVHPAVRDGDRDAACASMNPSTKARSSVWATGRTNCRSGNRDKRILAAASMSGRRLFTSVRLLPGSRAIVRRSGSSRNSLLASSRVRSERTISVSGWPTNRHVHARLPVQGHFKGKHDDHRLDQPGDRLDPALAPCPDLRTDVIKDRDAELSRRLPEHDIEIGKIDQDEEVRPFLAKETLQPGKHPVDHAEMGDHLGDAHHGDFGCIGQQRYACRRMFLLPTPNKAIEASAFLISRARLAPCRSPDASPAMIMIFFNRESPSPHSRPGP